MASDPCSGRGGYLWIWAAAPFCAESICAELRSRTAPPGQLTKRFSPVPAHAAVRVWLRVLPGCSRKAQGDSLRRISGGRTARSARIAPMPVQKTPVKTHPTNRRPCSFPPIFRPGRSRPRSARPACPIRAFCAVPAKTIAKRAPFVSPRARVALHSRTSRDHAAPAAVNAWHPARPMLLT